MKYSCNRCDYSEKRTFNLAGVRCPICPEGVLNLSDDNLADYKDSLLIETVITTLDTLSLEELREIEKRVQILINTKIFGEQK